jgi:hypothetical protein
MLTTLDEPDTCNLEVGVVVPIPTLPAEVITILEFANVALELSALLLLRKWMFPSAALPIL